MRIKNKFLFKQKCKKVKKRLLHLIKQKLHYPYPVAEMVKKANPKNLPRPQLTTRNSQVRPRANRLES